MVGKLCAVTSLRLLPGAFQLVDNSDNESGDDCVRAPESDCDTELVHRILPAGVRHNSATLILKVSYRAATAQHYHSRQLQKLADVS